MEYHVAMSHSIATIDHFDLVYDNKEKVGTWELLYDHIEVHLEVRTSSDHT